MVEINLKQAFQHLDKNESPWPGSGIDWFVVGPQQRLNPLMYASALVTDRMPRDFNTRDGILELTKRDYSVFSRKALKEASSSEFILQVLSSMKLTDEQLLARIGQAQKIPKRRMATVQVFVRNPDVVAFVQRRAKGTCEACGVDAPFKAAKSGEPYLEIHHKKRLADGGEDTIDNAIAVCPNCHRKMHFG